MLKKNCLFCKKKFCSLNNNQKFCKRVCYASSLIGRPLTKDWKENIRNGMAGKTNYLWKGEKASYNAKHHWINRWFGKPQECERCGTTEKRMYHWANISGEYKRKRSDYIRLCVPCHKKFDKGKNSLFKKYGNKFKR